MNDNELIYMIVKSLAYLSLIGYAIYITSTAWPLVALIFVPIWNKNDREDIL